MKFPLIITGGLLAASLGSAAFAQDATAAAPTTDAAPAQAATPDMAPSADKAGVGASASAPDTMGSVAPTETTTTVTLTNGPVPDTAENRARFGAPMSHAGKKTKPIGN